ncbi:MAG TPA: hypothetical protein VHG88_16130 [Burkholderiales bacterium]|nr:hypothetical protein [Burkholderiales bacterium]
MVIGITQKKHGVLRNYPVVGHVLVLLLVLPVAAFALSSDAREFMRIVQELEPVLSKSADPEDLAAISNQQKEAFYRCE